MTNARSMRIALLTGAAAASVVVLVVPALAGDRSGSVK